MAEGWAKHLKADLLKVYSAGTDPKGLNLNAIRVMAEVGVDISNQHSKHFHEFEDIPLDFIITLCSNAKGTCPTFPEPTRLLHVNFDDPSIIVGSAQTIEETLNHYRRVRDEIRSFIETLPNALKGLL